MKKIPFTDREMQRAWRENMAASDKISRGNPHRLLLFYAVECGLKAALMKRQGCSRTDERPDIHEAGHNINKLLDSLRAGKNLNLPDKITMQHINRPDADTRILNPDQINQMWRYGGRSIQPSDDVLEKKLSDVSEWIKKEIGV